MPFFIRINFFLVITFLIIFDIIFSQVARLLPEAHLDTETAGNLSYSLERARIEDVANFFRFVEAEIAAPVRDRIYLHITRNLSYSLERAH